MKQVAIIGGGIAGLSTAYYLQKDRRRHIQYKVIEESPRFGGKIVSVSQNGFVVEGGPDAFLTTKPAALELARDLGLGDALISTNDAARKVFVEPRQIA